MNRLAVELQPLIALALGQGGVVFLRVAAVIAVLPAFGERTVPVRVKLMLALMFTAIVAPAVGPVTALDGPGKTVLVVVCETVIGLAIGLAIRLFVLALQTAGSIAAQSSSLAQLLGGAAAEPIPAMGYVLAVAGLALAVMSGLHVEVARLLIRSYDLFPAGRFPAAGPMADWGVVRVAQAFGLAFTLAVPFVIASVIYNLTLGVINRAMPQLMVAFVGAPVITFGGLFLLLVASPTLLAVWNNALFAFLANPGAGAP
ncbi:MAG: flagellar biosynthetic protein FliR [Pseudooceanicola sp.]|nr:flagellar biosynthetic protein FliR [Pseudooceanicola sp.]